MTTTSLAPFEATLIARPHPFAQRPAVVAVRAGRTIAEILEEATEGEGPCATLSVKIGGYEVPPKLWDKVRPKAGTQIECTVMPAGDSAKKWLRVILMVVVMIVAWYVTPYLTGTLGILAGATPSLVWSGLTLAGTLAVNALVPPPKPKLPSMGGDAPERQFALTGTNNQVNQYGVIPLVIGEMRYYPPHAALPYTEEYGSVKYMRMMLDLGYGEFDVSDIRIGETPITAFQGVEYEITKTPTLYTSDVFEDQVGAALNDGNVITRTTQPLVDEIAVVIDFVGLFGADKKGRIKQATAFVQFEYRAVGSPTWLPAPIGTGRAVNWAGGQVRTSNRNPFTVSVSWKVPVTGQYEVRVSRSSTYWDGAEANTQVGNATFAALRSIRAINPSTTGTTKLCLRIKASDQINGTVQTVNVVQRQKVPVFNGSAWVVQHTKNPAWIRHWLLTQCPAVAVRLPPEAMDFQAHVDFAAYCEARELECSMVVDSGVPLMELDADILASGMGSRSLRDGKVSVVWEQPNAQPVGAFTPANYIKFGSQRTFYDRPHALRVKFTNPDAGYITDEIVVVDDGYSWRGKDARGNPSAAPEATRFETIDLRACRRAQAAWRAARYYMAQGRFRPVNYTMDCDIENLRYTRGDVVSVLVDEVDWGEGWGRVKSLVGNVLTIDEMIEMRDGETYTMQLRKQDGTMVSVPVLSWSGNPASVFTLASAPAGVAEGDIAVLGSATRATRNLIITGIQPQADLKATLLLADHAPEIEAFISNPPASIVSEATGRTWLDPPDPPRITVVLSSQVADVPDDGGTTRPRVHIGIRDGGGGGFSRGSGSPWRNLQRLV